MSGMRELGRNGEKSQRERERETVCVREEDAVAREQR